MLKYGGCLDLWQQVFGISPARGFVMELKWFEDFLSVSHCYSFTRAASERNITQSALSRRIRQLEEWLGVVLFDRKTYPIRLTPEGEEFLHVAHATVFSMTRLRRSFRAKAHETDVTV
ncbi:LysR family transcriptional regulator [Rahnella inusitata]|uniref:LysR family transcriptional regulator n=2 Tax=Rahnella inusitata TaxID=58169 RepID=UPI0039BDDC92